MCSCRSWILAPLLCLCAQAAGAWTAVGTGIEYQEFTVSGPKHVYVARMDRNNTAATIESSIAQGKLSGGRETVRGQALRYDEAINWWGQSWGQRNDVIVAINGDFWDAAWVGIPVDGQIHSGWYAKRFRNFETVSHFGWTLDRQPFIAYYVSHTNSKQIVTYTAAGATQKFQGINRPRGTDELIVYTPQYDATTLTDNSGLEVVVQMTRPTLILPTPAMALGYVREVRPNQGSTPIPFDCVVLSASGTAVDKLAAYGTVGAEIGISQEINGTVDWTKTYASVGGNFQFLKDGVVYDGSGNAGLTVRDPRTAIAYSGSYVFFIVVDGRDPGVSEGMNMAELGNFCKTYLGATDGVNQDGGGSSTMVVNGVVKNNPSDGSERAVANGMMMINVLPKAQSATFTTGQAVKTTTASNIRLGPGTNYGVLTTIPGNTSGTVMSHDLNGVLAKGYNWWKVDFSGTKGWLVETLLAPEGGPPTITEHPQPQVACMGDAAVFSVAATGSGTLTYQWQKEGADITDGGHYSGAATSALTVLNVDAADVADYLCVVTNSYGSATSNAAALTLNQTPPTAVTVTDEGDWTPSLDTLKAWWTDSFDACGLGINRYEYAIGASPAAQDVKDWTSAGLDTSMTSSLALAEGQTYYVQVRAVDNAGLVGPAASSDGITVAPEVDRIGAAWALADSVGFSLRNKTVTAVLPGAFWIEEQDRSAAMKVVSAASVAAGDAVDVAGVLGVSGSQRALIADVVESLGGSSEIEPVGMVQRSLGGGGFNASTPGVTDAVSLYNIGLLARCAGVVTHSDSTDPDNKYFYFDDGSGLSDGSGHAGVKVLCGSLTPAVSGLVTVTGIVATEQVGAKVAPVILVRRQADMIPL